MLSKYDFKYLLFIAHLTYTNVLECVSFMSGKTFGTTEAILSGINHPTQHCCHEIKVFVVCDPIRNKTTIIAFKNVLLSIYLLSLIPEMAKKYQKLHTDSERLS